jgi:hypothetical protein
MDPPQRANANSGHGKFRIDPPERVVAIAATARHKRTDAPKENRRSLAEIKCERRTAADAPMYLRHRYWQRVGVPEAGIMD